MTIALGVGVFYSLWNIVIGIGNLLSKQASIDRAIGRHDPEKPHEAISH